MIEISSLTAILLQWRFVNLQKKQKTLFHYGKDYFKRGRHDPDDGNMPMKPVVFDLADEFGISQSLKKFFRRRMAFRFLSWD